MSRILHAKPVVALNRSGGVYSCALLGMCLLIVGCRGIPITSSSSDQGNKSQLPLTSVTAFMDAHGLKYVAETNAVMTGFELSGRMLMCQISAEDGHTIVIRACVATRLPRRKIEKLLNHFTNIRDASSNLAWERDNDLVGTTMCCPPDEIGQVLAELLRSSQKLVRKIIKLERQFRDPNPGRLGPATLRPVPAKEPSCLRFPASNPALV